MRGCKLKGQVSTPSCPRLHGSGTGMPAGLWRLGFGGFQRQQLSRFDSTTTQLVPLNMQACMQGTQLPPSPLLTAISATAATPIFPSHLATSRLLTFHDVASAPLLSWHTCPSPNTYVRVSSQPPRTCLPACARILGCLRADLTQRTGCLRTQPPDRCVAAASACPACSTAPQQLGAQ